MNQVGYLLIVIALLALMAGFALFGYFFFRKDRKAAGHKTCQGCEDTNCPLAAKLREKEEE